MTTTERVITRQPRDRSVPCCLCGFTRTSRGITPRTLTWNTSALCDRHEAQEAKR